jgi:hypothetical protein
MTYTKRSTILLIESCGTHGRKREDVDAERGAAKEVEWIEVVRERQKAN